MSRFCEPCFSVSKQIPASHKCVDCVELYCNKCSEDHTKFRAFRKHTLVVLEVPLEQIRPEKLEAAEYKIRVNEKCKLSEPGQQKTTESFYENVILATGVQQIKLEGASTGENCLYSGSDDVYAGKKTVRAAAAVLDADKRTLYAGSDDLDADKTTLYAGSDDLDADTQELNASSEEWSEPHYSSVEDTDQPVNHFYIRVDDTPLSRAMGIQKGQRYLLVICKETRTLTVSINDRHMFECPLSCIRRIGYNHQIKTFWIEFGRRFQYGPGSLQFKLVNGKELQSRFKETGF